MTELPYRCPQCGGSFLWGDGYPDLFGVRLCSLVCQGVWLRVYRYTNTLPDELPGQMSEFVVQQQGDGRNSGRETSPGDPGVPEDPHRQME